MKQKKRKKQSVNTQTNKELLPPYMVTKKKTHTLLSFNHQRDVILTFSRSYITDLALLEKSI